MNRNKILKRLNAQVEMAHNLENGAENVRKYLESKAKENKCSILEYMMSIAVSDEELEYFYSNNRNLPF